MALRLAERHLRTFASGGSKWPAAVAGGAKMLLACQLRSIAVDSSMSLPLRQPDERVCHNKAKKKRCLSGNQPPIFDCDADVCCSACIQGYKYNGNALFLSDSVLIVLKKKKKKRKRRMRVLCFINSPLTCLGKSTPKRVKLLQATQERG